MTGRLNLVKKKVAQISSVVKQQFAFLKINKQINGRDVFELAAFPRI